MKNRRNSYYLYLNWPVYLAQWYAHEMYRLKHSEDEHISPYIYDCSAPVTELDPVDTRRGSAERNILEMCLSKQPDNIRVLPSTGGALPTGLVVWGFLCLLCLFFL